MIDSSGGGRFSHWLGIACFTAILIITPHRCAAITPVDSTKSDSILVKAIFEYSSIRVNTALINSVQKEFDKDAELQSRINTQLGMSFRSNESDQHKSLLEIGASATVGMGIYPHVMQFEMRSNVEYRNDELSENVSTLYLNYNDFPNPRMQVYAFMERFADDFMSIDQRYEIGVGMMLHIISLGELKQKPEEIPNVRRLLNRLDPPQPIEPSSDARSGILAREFIEHLKRTRTSAEIQAARLRFGIAFTLFEELERATIEAEFIDSATGGITSRRYPSPPSYCYRGVVRPTLAWHVFDQLEIKGLFYFKFRLFNNNNRDVHLRRDWRSDSFLTAELKLSGKDAPSRGDIKLALNIDNRFDNSPPEIPAEIVAAASGSIDPIAAARNHLLVSMEIKIEL
jgi:hypothetical protein